MPSNHASLFVLGFALFPTIAFAGPAMTEARKAPTATSSSARDAAQKGIHFLAQSTAQWATTHRCYGYHVQAVTIEALAVGKSNQYDVPGAQLGVIRKSILEDDGGSRGPNGLWHGGFPRTARTFGGSAIARYDQFIDTDLGDDLIRVARQLLAYQAQDGSVVGDHQSYPVTTGVMQATFQAMQTWRQAYARTADNVWLAPIQKAERFVQKSAAQWDSLDGAVYLQDINYALLGLMAAGVSRSEETADRLIRHLTKAQRDDGGWGFNGASDAYATGQTVYALRVAGLSEQDRAVSRGINWLVRHQASDGSWGGGGSGKAEAMWAVLGMVSVDVMTVAVSGIKDGTRLAAVNDIVIQAKDNQGGRAKKVALFVDDVLLVEKNGGELKHRFDAGKLASGTHIIDAVATNETGRTSRRRMVVYAGDVFLTQLGTRSDGAVTQFTLRNLARSDEKGSVRMRIHAADEQTATGSGALLHEQTVPGTPGAMALSWNGSTARNKALPAGRYVVEMAWLDGKGRALQSERAVFFHGNEVEQKASTAEVRGQLKLRGAAPAANTRVELVDKDGRVVQSTVSTEAGEYRFKNVDDGNYKVRVRKDGFEDAEAPVAAKKAAESNASMSLH